ncbi:MAG TPA: PTPA-CTERM sorting domain-containing protein [Trichocoleus sp.]|jgi:hypothetical protein
MATLPVFLRSSAGVVLFTWIFTITAHPAQAKDPIANGGFETGDFLGWSVTGLGSASPTVTNDSGFVHEGTYGAIVDKSQGSLSQTFKLNKNEAYKLTYSLKALLPSAGTAQPEPSYFVVSMNGVPIAGGSVNSKDFKVHQVIFNPKEELTEIQFTLIGNKGTLALDDVSLKRVITGAPPPFLLGAGAAAASTGTALAGGDNGGGGNSPAPGKGSNNPNRPGVVKPFPEVEALPPGSPQTSDQTSQDKDSSQLDKSITTPNQPKPIPTPALLPGLIGFGWSVLKKRNQTEHPPAKGAEQ